MNLFEKISEVMVEHQSKSLSVEYFDFLIFMPIKDEADVVAQVNKMCNFTAITAPMSSGGFLKYSYMGNTAKVEFRDVDEMEIYVKIKRYDS